MTRRWADVAELIATQGLKGRLVARSVRGLPFLLHEGITVHFVPPTLDGPRTASVRSVQHLGSQEYAVQFSGVSKRDTAELLTGSHCLVARADLPDDFEDIVRSSAEYLSGFLVVDEVLGDIGTISDVREMPAQDLLVVTAPGGEVLVPFVEDFIVEFDDAERVLYMDLPDGLVDPGVLDESSEKEDA